MQGQDLRIVGFVEKVGNPQDDSQLIIPLDIAVDLFGGKEEYVTIMADVVEGQEPSKGTDGKFVIHYWMPVELPPPLDD